MKKPRHVSDEVAEGIMQEAGSRSVNTAMFATNVVAIQLHHGKATDGKETSVEEATRQFWQRTLGMEEHALRDTASPDETKLDQRHPQHLGNLRPTIRVLTRLCEQVISDEKGLHASQHVISTPPPRCIHKRPDQVLDTDLERAARQPEGGSSMADFQGANGYIAAIRKVRSHHLPGPIDTSDRQAASFLNNGKAAAFLENLRHHSSRSAWENTQSQRVGSPNMIAQQQSWWQVGKAAAQAPSTARPWVVLAGPGFVPEAFAATGEPEDCAALEELKNPRKPFGPDVSHLPRPSDKLAFQHQNQGHDAELPPIRKTLADMFDFSLLSKVPPKVVYNGKVISSIDSLARTISEPSLEMVPFYNRSRHAIMLAKMKQVEAAALKDQPTALHLLVLKRQTELQDSGRKVAEAQEPAQSSEPIEKTSDLVPELPASLGVRCNDA